MNINMQIIKSIAFLRKLICEWSIFRMGPCLEVQMLNDESFFRLPGGPGNLVAGLLGAVRRTYFGNHDAEKVRSCQGVS